MLQQEAFPCWGKLQLLPDSPELEAALAAKASPSTDSNSSCAYDGCWPEPSPASLKRKLQSGPVPMNCSSSESKRHRRSALPPRRKAARPAGKHRLSRSDSIATVDSNASSSFAFGSPMWSAPRAPRQQPSQEKAGREGPAGLLCSEAFLEETVSAHTQHLCSYEKSSLLHFE